MCFFFFFFESFGKCLKWVGSSHDKITQRCEPRPSLFGQLGSDVKFEHFRMEHYFNLSFFHVANAPASKGKRRIPGQHPFRELHSVKRCVVHVAKHDQGMCCARAIVTAKAIAHNHSNVRAFKRNRNIQVQCARPLIEDVDLRPGLCGPRELTRLALAELQNR